MTRVIRPVAHMIRRRGTIWSAGHIAGANTCGVELIFIRPHLER